MLSGSLDLLIPNIFFYLDASTKTVSYVIKFSQKMIQSGSVYDPCIVVFKQTEVFLKLKTFKTRNKFGTTLSIRTIIEKACTSFQPAAFIEFQLPNLEKLESFEAGSGLLLTCYTFHLIKSCLLYRRKFKACLFMYKLQ